ncbi:MAG: hypothetical protein HON99_03485 [Crocinitomicaceae bacterium]|jgi:hypothetical protein|nr:hypothetical protein [Crocinitomicaceae bacterium]MDG2332580.1 HIRAN domain-containing protein [Flavobacteriales bacterium]
MNNLAASIPDRNIPELGILTRVMDLSSFDMIYIYHHLSKGVALDLDRDYTHYYKNAVQVSFKGFKLGYLPEKVSAIVCARMDKGKDLIARIKSIEKKKYLPLKSLDIELLF